MKTTEESPNFLYLKDAIKTKNMDAYVEDNKLVLNINTKEMFLKNVETYSASVASRNREESIASAGYTYFTRLNFKGRLKLYQNDNAIDRVISTNNFVWNGNIYGYYSRKRLGSGYYNADVGLYLFDDCTAIDESSGLHTITRYNNRTQVTNRGIFGMIIVPEGKVANVTIQGIENSAGRYLALYSVGEDDSYVAEIPGTREYFNDDFSMKTFSYRLKSGSYYLRQSASANYYNISVSYDTGGYTTTTINLATATSPNLKIKLYRFDESNIRFINIASTDLTASNKKGFTNVSENILDGNNVYYISVYTPNKTELFGLSCKVGFDIIPWISFKYKGEAPDSFYAWDQSENTITPSQQTFSSSVETYDDENYN